MWIKMVALIVASLAAGHAAATPCDCSQKAGSCVAKSSYQNGRILIHSDTSRCSFVVYTINGNPTTSTVVDGTADSGWIGSARPQVNLRTCELCKDRRTNVHGIGNEPGQNLPSWASGEWRNGVEIITLNRDGKWTRWSVGLDRLIHQGTFKVNGNSLLLTPDSKKWTQTYTFTIGTGPDAGVPILVGRDNRIVRPDVWTQWSSPR